MTETHPKLFFRESPYAEWKSQPFRFRAISSLSSNDGLVIDNADEPRSEEQNGSFDHRGQCR